MFINFYDNESLVKELFVYRGEGNAHLALALPTSKRILLFKKTVQCGTNIGNFKYAENIRFYNVVIKSLFSNFVGNVFPIKIEKEESDRIADIIKSCRPVRRVQKSGLSDQVVIFEDYAYLSQEICSQEDTFAVEIKPKQGFTLKGVRCRFCTKQIVKLKEGSIQKVSTYCPLDLFSGDHARMLKAINALIENPQNNFHIFKNGLPFYGAKSQTEFARFLQEFFKNAASISELKDSFNFLLKSILLRSYPNVLETDCLHFEPKECLLPKNCALERMYCLQRVDVCGFMPATNPGVPYAQKYTELTEARKNSCAECTLNAILQEKSKLLQNQFTVSQICGSTSVNSKYELGDSTFERHIFSVPHYVHKISRDSSLMIAIKAVSDTNNIPNWIQTPHGCFAFDVKVFDLFPKPEKV